MTDGPTRKQKARRWWILSITLVASLAFATAIVHLPFARAGVLSWVTTMLQREGIVFEAERLDYNLLTRAVSLNRVTVAAEGVDPPFLEIEAVRLNLHWSALFGALRAQSVDIDRPRVTLVRRADGSLNLPTFAAADADPGLEGPIRIGRLLVSDLAFRYDAATSDHSFDGRGITLDMRTIAGGPLAGRLSMSDDATLRIADRTTTVSTLEGRLSFDGTALSIDSLSVETPEARARADGRVDVLGANPRVDLRYEAHLDVERIAPWIDLAPAPTGRLALAGTASGALSAPDLAVRVTSDALVWPALGALTLEGRGTLSGSTATVLSLRVAVAGGELSADGRVQIDNALSEAKARWSGIDLERLAGVAPELPFRIAAIADGSLTMTWTGRDVIGARGSLSASLRAPSSPGGALPLDGRINLALRDRRWTLVADQRIAGAIALKATANGRLEAAVETSTLDGRAEIGIADLGTALRNLESAGLAPDLGTRAPVRGSAVAAFDLGGTLGAPRAVGAFEAADLWFGEMGSATASARIDATPRLVSVDALRLALGSNVVIAHARLGLESNTLDGSLTADLPQLAAISTSLPAAWRPDGSAQMSATFGGALDNPTVALDVSSNGFRVAGQPIRSLRADVRLASRVFDLQALELTQDEGKLTATGHYRMDGGRYAFTAAGNSLVISQLALEEGAIPIDARFDLQIKGEGTAAAPGAAGQIQFARLDWGDYRVGPARADIALADGRAHIRTEVDTDLATLVRSSGTPAIPLAGRMSTRATADGPLDNLTDMAIDVELSLADASIAGVPLRLERPARLRHENGQVVAEDVALHIGGSTLTARGRFGTGVAGAEVLSIDLAGSIADFVPLLQLGTGMEEIDASGAIDMRVQASGPLQTPDVTARINVTRASIAAGELPPAGDVELVATYSAGLLDVTRLTGRWQGAEVSASAQAPARLLGDILPAAYLASLPKSPGPARADVRLSGITPAALAPFLAQETVDQLTGHLEVVASLEAAALDAGSVRADITFERAELELARVPLAQVQPTRLRLANRRLDVVEWSWAGAGNHLDIGGYAYLDAEAPRLNLDLAGSLDLRMIGAFAPEVATAGRASFDIKALGTTQDPTLEGRITLEDTDVIVREPRLAITDLKGVAILTGSRVRLDGVTANANGGTIDMTGSMDYSDFTISGGALTLTGRGLAFEALDGLRTEVDTDLTLTVAGGTPSIEGRATIVRGDYRRPLRLTEQLFAIREPRTVAAETAEPGFLDEIQLDVAVVSAEDIRVDNNYGRLELASNLRVAGTAAAPVLTGRLTMREDGEVFLGGQTYTVRRGTVDFTNATRIEPLIDLALETRVQRYDITLEISGTPETLEVNLRSPGLSQQDAISLLLTGQLADESTLAHADIARGQLLMLLSGELLSFAGRAVGLDTIQVSRGLGGASSTFDLLGTDSSPDARLTVAKNLSRNVELIFSQSLRESGDITWIATYRPIRRVEFRGTTDDDSNQAYEFRHELQFGAGGQTAAQQATTGQSASPRVTAVQVLGETGFDSEIRRQLRLVAGDPFDYYRWQQDRDRLIDFFRDRGYLEARLSARRRETGPDGVALEYHLTRGPRTTLIVDGFALPASAIDRMKTAWEQAVFDGFLVDDLEAIAREALVAARHMQATVEATISEPDAAEKSINVRIVPGPRFDQRSLVFTGNERVATSDLEAVVRARGLEDEAWLNPNAMASAVAEHYRSLGYLVAQVTPEPPVFLLASATLPVRIAEGPAFTIGALDVVGTTARPAEDARRATGLQPGAAYRPAEVEPARRRVEIEYLERGYNEARVSAAAMVDPEAARVDVVLTVVEGPQQVLGTVDVSGASVTSRATIDRALGFKTGEPVDLSDYYAAQKRLYDTGVFQSVDISVEPIGDTGGKASATEPVRASVVLQELPRYRFRYGFRVTDLAAPAEATRQVQPALVADLLNRNVFGRAVTAGAAGQIEANRRLVRGILSLPAVFGRPIVTNLFLTQSRQDFTPAGETAFIEDASDVTIEQRFRPRRTMAVTYGYTFARKHVFEVDPDPNSPLPPLELRTDVARLTGTYAWDTRDDPSNASRGWFHSSGFEFGPESLGSDLRFVRYLAQQYYFRRAGERTVLASAFRLGAGRGFGQDLIPSEKFYAGGSTTVRGFAEQGLGGVDFFGDPVGGNSLLLLNQEVRYPIYRWFRGVGFLDAGNVFANARDLSFTDLQVGTGFGVRIDSPFAVIRVDYGIPLTGRERQPRGRWYVAIGQTF